MTLTRKQGAIQNRLGGPSRLNDEQILSEQLLGKNADSRINLPIMDMTVRLDFINTEH